MNPEISILIPLYNVEKYVERCLRSIFSNSIIDKCEIIIVNDYSSDNSENIVKRLINEYSNLDITLYKHEYNRGLAAARNTAFSNAKGKYIICVDSDDWVEPDYLEELYNKAESEQCDITGCDFYLGYSDRTVYRASPVSNDHIECIRDMLTTKLSASLWTKLIKRSLLSDNNILWIEGINYSEDFLINLQCFYYAEKTGYVSKPLYHYCYNLGSYMHRLINFDAAQQIIRSVEEAEAFLKSKNQTELIETMKFKKLRGRNRIVFSGNKEVRTKYLTLWPEADTKLQEFNTSKIRKHILKKAAVAPKYAAFLLQLLYFVKRLVGRRLY